MINIQKFIKDSNACIIDTDDILHFHTRTIQNGNHVDSVLLLKLSSQETPILIKTAGYGNLVTTGELDKLVFTINAARTPKGAINEHPINNETISS